MRRIIVFLIMLFLSGTVYAKTVKVRSTVTKKGTYRQTHQRTSPNKTKLDNWSTKGNYNPNTGKSGTTDPYKK